MVIRTDFIYLGWRPCLFAATRGLSKFLKYITPSVLISNSPHSAPITFTTLAIVLVGYTGIYALGHFLFRKWRLFGLVPIALQNRACWSCSRQFRETDEQAICNQCCRVFHASCARRYPRCFICNDKRLR